MQTLYDEVIKNFFQHQVYMCSVDVSLTILGMLSLDLNERLMLVCVLAQKYFMLATLFSLIMVQVIRYIYISFPILLDANDDKVIMSCIQCINSIFSIFALLYDNSITPPEKSVPYAYLNHQSNSKDESFSVVFFLLISNVCLLTLVQIKLKKHNPTQLNYDLIQHSSNFELIGMVISAVFNFAFSAIINDLVAKPMTVHMSRQMSLWLTLNLVQFMYIKRQEKLANHACRAVFDILLLPLDLCFPY